MMTDFHFLRPLWWFFLLPCILFLWQNWKKSSSSHSWADICDAHLLSHLMQNKGENRRHYSLLLLFFSAFFMIFALSGPVWWRFPVPTYKSLQPRVIVLDLSDSMNDDDVKPDRLTRAKFILHDLFSRSDIGQTAMVVFTGEPFVVAPLTEDAKTIDALLPSLTQSIMPVGGQELDSALKEAAGLITGAGFSNGQILVLTATPPDAAADAAAAQLAKQGIQTSVMPILANRTLDSMFSPLAKAGNGIVVSMPLDADALKIWLNRAVSKQPFVLSQNNDIPLWRDEGRWFLIPALLCLLPVFRRGWLQRIKA